MGVSTDAILFYGYCWDDEHDLFDLSDDDELAWPDRLLRSRGETDPWEGFVESTARDYQTRRAEGDAWRAAHRTELDEWHAKQRAIESEFPVEIHYHGSDGWRVPFISVKSGYQRAWRGDVHMIAEDALTSTATLDFDDQLYSFIKATGIDVSGAQGPGWFLVSWWG
jgi:hypothetical protein